MKRVVPLLVAVLVAGLLAPAIHASGFIPPAQSHSAAAGGTGIAYWVGLDTSVVDETIAPDETGTLWFGLQNRRHDNATMNTTTVAYVNLTSTDLAFATPNLVIRVQPLLSIEWDFTNTTFTLAPNATSAAAAPVTGAAYSFTVEAYLEDGNATTLLGTTAGAGTVAIQDATVAPPPTGLPTTWLLAGGAVLLIGGGATAYALKQRRDRRVMNEAPRRSQVMREMELEKELEKVAEKEPERAEEIKQEIRAQEQVREKRREVQILEAKRADVLKTMDLLRKRHETGGLTKHQYDNMVAKKQQDLQRIEAEIAEMEAQDNTGGAAA